LIYDEISAYVDFTKAMKANYYCKHCKQFYYRKSKKRWIASYCTTTGKKVRLMRKDA